MSVVKYAIYDTIKSGIKGLKVHPKQVQVQEETETQKIIREVFKQAKENNDQLARQIDHLMQAHMDLAKVMLETVKHITGL